MRRRPTTATTTPTSAPSSCCEEYAAVSRRGVLGGALALGGLTSIFGSAVLTASPAQAATGGNVLVVLSLRGAADGLSLVVPHGDPAYYQARPGIAIAKASLLEADTMFGLHPALAPLQPMWRAGTMAAVHAAGLPSVNRSHFSAMEEVEDADPGSTARVGWLNRLIGVRPGSSPLQGFSVAGGGVPTSLIGPEPVMTGANVDAVGFAGDEDWDTTHARMRSLHTMWDGENSTLGTAMRSAFSAVDTFAPVQATTNRRSTYPDGDLGNALAAAARIIRGDVGVEVLTVDHGDWDMHTDLGTTGWGRMVENAGELARAVAAFFADLGTLSSRVTVVALSEFGRRVKENANYGLDHGYGNVMLAFGAGVKGGYHGTWPGLSATDDADLLVTTDYRNVLADVVESRFGASVPTVFPGLTRKSVGLMRA